MSIEFGPAITIPKEHQHLEVGPSIVHPVVLHRDDRNWYVTDKPRQMPQKTAAFSDEESGRERFLILARYFVAYTLRVYDVGPMSSGLSVLKRYLIGVPKSEVENVRKDPDFQGAREDERVEGAFKRAWQQDLRKAFIDLFGSPSGISHQRSPQGPQGIEVRLIGDWAEPLLVTPSNCCIWQSSDKIIFP
jgi:hypothetical protein